MEPSVRVLDTGSYAQTRWKLGSRSLLFLVYITITITTTIKSPRESHPRHLNHTIKKSNASHLFLDLQWQTTIQHPPR
jgi:hypothetical protein